MFLKKPNSFGRGTQRKLARNGHLPAPWAGRQFRRVLPIVHPADHHRILVSRQTVKSECAVAVLAVIGPEGQPTGIFIRKASSVEMPDEILLAGSALQGSRIQSYLQHPTGIAGVAVDRQFE